MKRQSIAEQTLQRQIERTEREEIEARRELDRVTAVLATLQSQRRTLSDEKDRLEAQRQAGRKQKS